MATMTAQPPVSTRPAPVHPEDDRFVPLAAEIGVRIAPYADQHDRENSFVHGSSCSGPPASA